MPLNYLVQLFPERRGACEDTYSPCAQGYTSMVSVSVATGTAKGICQEKTTFSISVVNLNKTKQKYNNNTHAGLGPKWHG